MEANAFDNGASAGVFLSGNDNVIRSNRINDAGASGIAIGAFPSNPGPFVNNRIASNEINGAGRLFNSSAISITNGSGTVVENNLVNGRRGTAPGIFVNNSAGTVVSTNSLSNVGTGILIQGTSTGTQVTGNRVAQNVFSGINVQSAATGTVVSGNNATANGANGISVSSSSTTITGNTAVQNAALGIFAVSGVVDGGGNRAFGNGNPSQCSPNIAC